MHHARGVPGFRFIQMLRVSILFTARNTELLEHILAKPKESSWSYMPSDCRIILNEQIYNEALKNTAPSREFVPSVSSSVSSFEA